jgi:hypothetical protein
MPLMIARFRPLKNIGFSENRDSYRGTPSGVPYCANMEPASAAVPTSPQTPALKAAGDGHDFSRTANPRRLGLQPLRSRSTFHEKQAYPGTAPPGTTVSASAFSPRYTREIPRTTRRIGSTPLSSAKKISPTRVPR